MINRLFNSFFLGLAFVSILDFLYFIGLKLHYFDLYKIDEYFNIIFVDNQNFYILLPLSLVVGYLLIYSQYSKVFMRIYLVCILIFCAMIYEPVGKAVSENILLTENQRFKFGSTVFSGDLLYTGRKNIYIYRKDLLKTVKLSKNEVTILTAYE